MIKETPMTAAISKMIAVKMKAIDQLIEEMVTPVIKVGNPADLIGKPYELWTPEDLQRLQTIYGTGPNSPLQRFIFNKEYEHLRELEAEV